MFPECRGPEDLYLDAVYSGAREDALDWLEEVQAAFPGWPVQLEPLSLSVSCHIGPGARAITLAKAVRPD